MLLNKEDFHTLTAKIRDYSGITIGEDKEYLLESRLMPIARQYSIDNLPDFVRYLKENKDEALLIQVIEAMTTNESSFFRDFNPFDCLRDYVLPDILSKCPADKTLRIWSSACSTGQEAYSIAMTLLESPLCAGRKFEILGTDINLTVVERARDGVYNQFEVQRGVPVTMLLKYFTQESEMWRVNDKLKQFVKFEKFNLLGSTLALGKFDIIFCRNVLIYFDSPTKEKVLEGLAEAAEPHSFLFTGGAESLLGLKIPFAPIEGKVSVFKLKE